jgi:cupin 2 domain-containing protein
MPNIFAKLPAPSPEEVFETILKSGHITIERIVSRGQTTPKGEWLEDGRHEWVLLLKGAAELVLSDGTRLSMQSGDHTLIPAHTRHRVEWTDPKQTSVWLAIYYPAS